MAVRFTRPDAASDMYNHAAMIRDEAAKFKTLTATAPTAGNSLPAPGGILQEYTEAGSRAAETIICAGTWQQIGDRVGCLLHDTVAGSTFATYVYSGGQVFAIVDAGATNPYNNGVDLYMNTTTFVVDSDGGSGTVWIGTQVGDSETNPDGIEAGTYVLIQLDQSEV